jgi:hypothetical protein
MSASVENEKMGALPPPQPAFDARNVIMTCSQRTILALVIAWCGVAITGLGMTARYGARAGSGSVASHWPAGTSIVHPADRFLLLVFVHPECPCSGSTLAELDRLMAKFGDRLTATIVFVKPTGNDQDWQKMPLWNQASAIPGAKLMSDVGGREAARFDASTSGQAFLFDSSGQMQFRGGITAGRGHRGDNDGEDCIGSIISGTAPPARMTSVYGFRLLDSPLPQSKGHPCRN